MDGFPASTMLGLVGPPSGAILLLGSWYISNGLPEPGHMQYSSMSRGPFVGCLARGAMVRQSGFLRVSATTRLRIHRV